MKAMVITATGAPLAIEARPAPTPRAGEVLLAVEACAVCRTDVHLIDGELPAALPRIPGHQVVGRVVEVGAAVRVLATGERVGVGWLFGTCGDCAFCVEGRENLCADARFTGRDVDGGYADLMCADARFAYRLPASFSAIEAAPLLCAGIIGYRSLRLSEVRPGGRIGLVGFGASAHIALQVASHWGCESFVFTRQAHHREMARDLGAAWTGDAADDPGVPLDAAVIFAPAGELIPLVLRRLNRGGTLAVNAIHATAIPAFEYAALYWERTVRSVANYTRRDAEEFLDLAARIPVRVQTETYPLESANDAIARVRRGEVTGAAVLAISHGAL